MLNRDIVLLQRFCDEVDGISFQTLSGRISFQKRIYLLQAAGIDLGFRFSWDLHGPYSKGLARAGDELAVSKDEAKEVGKKLEFTDEVKQRIEFARALMTPTQPLDEGQWLEFLASLHYLRFFRDLENREDAIEALKKLKPHFADVPEVAANEAWTRLGDAKVAKVA